MKLLSKYNRVNVPVMIGSLVVSSIAFYFILHFVLLNQLDKDLVIEEQEINEYVAHNQLLPRTSSYPDQVIAFYTVKAAPHRSFSSVNIYNKVKQEKELYRQLVFQVVVQDKLYAATVRKSQQESEDLLKLIVSITLAVILLLFLGIFTVNRFILRQLWRPFHTVMEQLKKFDISGKSELQFSTSDIDEFNVLNKTAKLLTNKVTSDYEALKSFTENASHEIQTPLAIIQMKLELLMQSENMAKDQVDIVVAIHEAADRLSRLNQSLLLLTKLDNSQFVESEKVVISLLMEKHLENVEELVMSKKIALSTFIETDVIVVMNRTLAEILISNLLANAIKHNYDDGKIDIILNNQNLIIRNTGREHYVNPEDLFKRFKKESSAPDSLGLGLAIIKKICDTYSYGISYDFTTPWHNISIDFRKRS